MTLYYLRGKVYLLIIFFIHCTLLLYSQNQLLAENDNIFTVQIAHNSSQTGFLAKYNSGYYIVTALHGFVKTHDDIFNDYRIANLLLEGDEPFNAIDKSIIRTLSPKYYDIEKDLLMFEIPNEYNNSLPKVILNFKPIENCDNQDEFSLFKGRFWLEFKKFAADDPVYNRHRVDHCERAVTVGQELETPHESLVLTQYLLDIMRDTKCFKASSSFIEPGCSGSPIYSDNNNLIGLVSVLKDGNVILAPLICPQELKPWENIRFDKQADELETLNKYLNSGKYEEDACNYLTRHSPYGCDTESQLNKIDSTYSRKNTDIYPDVIRNKKDLFGSISSILRKYNLSCQAPHIAKIHNEFVKAFPFTKLEKELYKYPTLSAVLKGIHWEIKSRKISATDHQFREQCCIELITTLNQLDTIQASQKDVKFFNELGFSFESFKNLIYENSLVFRKSNCNKFIDHEIENPQIVDVYCDSVVDIFLKNIEYSSYEELSLKADAWVKERGNNDSIVECLKYMVLLGYADVIHNAIMAKYAEYESITYDALPFNVQIKDTSLEVNFAYGATRKGYGLDVDVIRFDPGSYYSQRAMNANKFISESIAQILQIAQERASLSSKLKIEVHGMADATPFSSSLIYNGEFGESIKYDMFDNQARETQISLNQLISGNDIYMNYALAYLRASSVEKEINSRYSGSMIKKRISVSGERGGQYRGIEVNVRIPFN